MFIPLQPSFGDSPEQHYNYALRTRVLELEDELESEKSRADALDAELIKANKEVIRIQKWRIALIILLTVASIAAILYGNGYLNMDREYRFYHEHASIVTQNGNYYHRYGCEKVTADSFYILNTNYAESLGYKQCEHCWD